MSPARPFSVTMLFHRTLTLEVTTTSIEAAEAIARYVYDTFGKSYFQSAPEAIVQVIAVETPEARS